MRQEFTIDDRLGSMNEYIRKCRTGTKGIIGNIYKHQQQDIVKEFIRKSNLQKVTDYPVEVIFYFYEKNYKRDLDNVSSWAHKCILDALVKEEILENDGWKQIISIKDIFEVDKENPRIVVVIESLDQQRK